MPFRSLPSMDFLAATSHEYSVVHASSSVRVIHPPGEMSRGWLHSQRFRIELRKKVRVGRLVKVLSIFRHATEGTANPSSSRASHSKVFRPEKDSKPCACNGGD